MSDEKVAAEPKVEYLTDEKLSHTLTLEYPFKYDGVEYRELTVHRLKGVKLMKYSQQQQQFESNEDQTAFLLAVLCSVPKPVIEALMADDFASLSEVLPDFLPKAMLEESTIHSSGTGSQQS